MYFSAKKSVFLVSAENGAGVNKKTNISGEFHQLQFCEKRTILRNRLFFLNFPKKDPFQGEMQSSVLNLRQ